jgi:SAM-dependent methyltransferase
LIAEGFLWLTARFPSARRYAWRALFEVIALYFRRAESWTLMNYGYAEADAAALPALDRADWDERYPLYLYHRVAGGVDLRDRTVLEVGSGRGGGASYVKRYLGPRRVVGVDAAASAVDFCKRVHRVEGLEFRHGYAEALPFEAECFDAVINVESSFCYASIDRFLLEVRRVLRPGGHFLYADIRLAGELPDLERAIAASGLRVLEHDDITRNVVAALELDSERRERGSRRGCPRLLRKPFGVFLGTSGTRIPTGLADGRMRYVAYVLRKPR